MSHRSPLISSTALRLTFAAPDKEGDYNYSLFLICDSYLGCAQELEVERTFASHLAVAEERDLVVLLSTRLSGELIAEGLAMELALSSERFQQQIGTLSEAAERAQTRAPRCRRAALTLRALADEIIC